MKHSVVKCSVVMCSEVKCRAVKGEIGAMCSEVKCRAVKGEIGAQWCATPMEKQFLETRFSRHLYMCILVSYIRSCMVCATVWCVLSVTNEYWVWYELC